MARLIDGDALKVELSNFEFESSNTAFLSGMIFVAKDFIPTLIDAQPTIDAQPVRHGHWMFLPQKNGYLWKCSMCKGNFDQQYSFCPHCGAKMDGGEDNG